ncbi:MAG: hypothetical protein LC790_15695, partial [Actinobacteria bacterium]|nr:hypothetical protein [Actinomycetota bacterium]
MLMRRLLLLADVAGLLVAFLLIELVFGSHGSPDDLPLEAELAYFALSLPIWLVGANIFGLYHRDEERADHSTSDDFIRVMLLVTLAVFLMTRVSALTPVADADELKVSVFWLLAIVCMTAARGFARLLGRRDV